MVFILTFIESKMNLVGNLIGFVRILQRQRKDSRDAEKMQWFSSNPSEATRRFVDAGSKTRRWF